MTFVCSNSSLYLIWHLFNKKVTDSSQVSNLSYRLINIMATNNYMFQVKLAF